jgi:cytochrome c biogenesis protein CcdA/thiol-disulfide isomerase/thioredoxin
MLLSIFAFLSGLATVVSPCVLPVLPMVLSTSVGAGRWRPLGVVLGLTGTFTVATLAGAAAAQALAVPSSTLRTLSIAMLALFGLSMLIPSWGHALGRWFSPVARMAGGSASTQRSGLGGGMLMGAALGLLWAPCVGPIMGSVLALAVSRGVSPDLAWITLAYALGCGLPLLFIGYGARRLLAGARSLGPRSGLVRQAFGALTLLACLALFFGLESRVQALVPTAWSNALTGFERAAGVQQEIDKLAPAPASASHTQPLIAAATQAPAALPTNTAQAAPKPAEPTAAAISQSESMNDQQSKIQNPKPKIDLPDLGPAAELTGLGEWINSKPLTLEALRGKVVIVDFWTFACYNCRNTQPYVRALYDKYHGQGLEILGIHTPELSFERVPDNVRSAAKEQGVIWPIALDPDYKTWSAYNNRYWPAFYFIDAKGHLRYTHFGEGNYDYHDKVVQQLLDEAASASR